MPYLPLANHALPAEPAAYSVDAFCAAHGVGRTTVYAEIKAGRLIASKVGRRTIILAEHARAWRDALPKLAKGEAE